MLAASALPVVFRASGKGGRRPLRDAQGEPAASGVEGAIPATVAPGRAIAAPLAAADPDRTLHIRPHRDREHAPGQAPADVAVIGLSGSDSIRAIPSPVIGVLPVARHRQTLPQPDIPWPPTSTSGTRHLRGCRRREAHVSEADPCRMRRRRWKSGHALLLRSARKTGRPGRGPCRHSITGGFRWTARPTGAASAAVSVLRASGRSPGRRDAALPVS